VVTNMRPKGEPNAHGAVTVALSGKGSYTGPNRYIRPTLDQVVARAWKPQTRFSSLHLGVSSAGGGLNGSREFIFEHLSWTGTGGYNASEFSTQKVFDRLFGMDRSTAHDAAAALIAARASVLDTVRGDVQWLKARIGAADCRRLDEHLEGVRALEIQIRTQPTCAAPARPDADPASAMEHLEARNAQMSDLLALALSCNLTRVFTMNFSRPECETIFWMLGGAERFHTMTHKQGSSPVIPAAMTFTMKQLGVLLTKLAALKEGAGTLLDSCCLFGTSDIGDPRSHSFQDFPILVMGKAGGKLRPGVHHRSPSNDTMCTVHLTMLRALGLPLESFGEGPDLTTRTVPALEA
jgi:hypothetical protein